MTRTEDRLRDALHVKAGAVRDDRLRPLAESRPAARRGHRGWLAPLSAAVAVTLVAVLAVTLTGNQPSPSSGPAGPSPQAQAPMPRYFTEIDRASIQVRSVATGKLIGVLPASEVNRMSVVDVAAAPDGRTFYLFTWRLPVRPQPVIYSFSITSTGRLTPVRLVASGPTASFSSGGPSFVVSPDGTELAFTVNTGRQSQTPAIVVLNLRTGKHQLWDGGLPTPSKHFGFGLWDLSWSGSRTLDFVASWCGNAEWLYCGTGTAQLRALSVGTDGGSLASSTTLTSLTRFPNVTSVVADQQGRLTITQVSPRGIQGAPVRVTIDQVAAPTGAVLRVLYQRTYPWNPNNIGPVVSDPSGQYLMVWVFGMAGWVHDGALRRPPANPPYPYPDDFAW
jgi:hypothetical protein